MTGELTGETVACPCCRVSIDLRQPAGYADSRRTEFQQQHTHPTQGSTPCPLQP